MESTRYGRLSVLKKIVNKIEKEMQWAQKQPYIYPDIWRETERQSAKSGYRVSAANETVVSR